MKEWCPNKLGRIENYDLSQNKVITFLELIFCIIINMIYIFLCFL